MSKVKTKCAASSFKEKLLEKAKNLPKKSGCYLMQRLDGSILYIGKAKDLRSRVSSYFNLSAKTAKTDILVGHIRDFDFIITETEVEALILENNLIKKHRPKYNIRLKDDKSYPYIVVDRNEEYPRLVYTRHFKKKKKLDIFGPYVVGSNVSEIMRILIKSFSLRDCTLREFNSRDVPCLLYQMKQCSAPCVSLIDKEVYQRDLKMALSVLKGKTSRPFKILKERMHSLAESEDFEQAAVYRDFLEELEKFISFTKKQNVLAENSDENIDIIAFTEGKLEIEIAIYLVRRGMLLGHKSFHFPVLSCQDTIQNEVLDYLIQYYSETFDPSPSKIIIAFPIEVRDLLEEALKQILKEDIKICGPEKNYQALYKMTLEYAQEQQKLRETNKQSTSLGLNKLKELLNLKEMPKVLECFDVAVWQGKSPTAAQIVFHEGVPDKSSYRHYNLQERPEGNNDFMMLKEMLERRMKYGNYPDVFVVDGGVGQVNIFRGVLKDCGYENIPVVGISKSRVEKNRNTFKKEKVERSEERLIIPGRSNPYVLKKSISLFRIITQMRDEAHRFSRRLHHKKEKERTFKTWPDLVPGIGPKTKKKILEKLDLPIDTIKKMDEKEVAAHFDIKEKLASTILETLRNL